MQWKNNRNCLSKQCFPKKHLVLAHSQTALIIAHNQRKYNLTAKIKLNLTKAELAFLAPDCEYISNPTKRTLFEAGNTIHLIKHNTI